MMQFSQPKQSTSAPKAPPPLAPVDEEEIPLEIMKMSNESIRNRAQLMDGEIRIMRSEVQRLTHNMQTIKDKIKENAERIKVQTALKRETFLVLALIFR